jgi:hypothetical protein
VASGSIAAALGQPGTPSQGYQLAFTPAELFRTALKAINAELAQASTSFAQMIADQQDAYLQGLGWNAYGRRRQRAVPAFHSAGISAGIAAGFPEAAGEPLRRMTQLCSRSK